MSYIAARYLTPGDMVRVSGKWETIRECLSDTQTGDICYRTQSGREICYWPRQEVNMRRKKK